MTKPKFDATRTVGEGPQDRKAYASPQLVMYGNISQITRAVGMTGAADGGKAGMRKASA